MRHWGPTSPSRNSRLPSSLPSAGSWVRKCGAGSGGGGSGRWGDRGALSQPARGESAHPSPGPGERLEHKAIFIYDTVSGLASV